MPMFSLQWWALTGAVAFRGLEKVVLGVAEAASSQRQLPHVQQHRVLEHQQRVAGFRMQAVLRLVEAGGGGFGGGLGRSESWEGGWRWMGRPREVGVRESKP